ncbi:MAG TPA: hypothetical protein VG650_07470 [Mycobacteriales bacterium]|nr:hypothetical protein [Mycobacteriales bacterium]
MPADDLLLPEGSLLLHIGPFKTGTTALQSGIRNALPTLKEHGVVQIGEVRRNVRRAVLAITENRGLSGDAPPSAALWRNMVADIHRVDAPRAILSSEFLCDASAEAAREIVSSIGRERLHVVVTLRPLSRILPSAWQQYVRNRLTTPYDEWLDAMLNRAPYRQPTPSFWRRHRHGNLVAKWAELVGPDQVSVVIVDERDRNGFLRAFERMLGVPDGLLVPAAAVTNRSLTAAEIELIRQINLEFDGNGWSDEIYHKFIRNGVIWRMLRRTPSPDEQRIITPLWAQELAAQAAAKSVRRINRLGVRIIGDPHVLEQVDPPPTETPPPAELPVAAGVGNVVAILYRSGLVVSPSDAAADEEEEEATLAAITAPMTRAEKRLRRRARRVRVWYSRRRALRAASRQPGGQVKPPSA